MKAIIAYIVGVAVATIITILALGEYAGGQMTFYSALIGGLIVAVYYAIKNKHRKTAQPIKP